MARQDPLVNPAGGKGRRPGTAPMPEPGGGLAYPSAEDFPPWLRPDSPIDEETYREDDRHPRSGDYE